MGFAVDETADDEISQERSAFAEKLLKNVTGPKGERDHLRKSIKALIVLNKEILKKCEARLEEGHHDMGFTYQDKSSMELHLKRSIVSQVRVHNYNDRNHYYVRNSVRFTAERQIQEKSFDFKKYAFPEDLLCLAPGSQVSCETLMFPDFESILKFSYILSEDALDSFLIRLQGALESYQEGLGLLDDWLNRQPAECDQYMKKTFNTVVPILNGECEVSSVVYEKRITNEKYEMNFVIASDNDTNNEKQRKRMQLILDCIKLY